MVNKKVVSNCKSSQNLKAIHNDLSNGERFVPLLATAKVVKI